MIVVSIGAEGFEPVFDNLPSGLMLYDVTRRLLRVNARGRAIFVLDMSEDCDFSQVSHLPAYLAAFVPLLTESIEDVPRSELEVHLPGQTEPATIGFSLKRVALNPMPDDAERFVHILTFSDITQVVRDRLAMERVKDELNQSKKLASIGTMVSGVAHELNNPLTGISMSTQLSRMMLTSTLQQLSNTPGADKALIRLGKVVDELAKIERESKKASILVSDLLDYSRPSRMKLRVASIGSVVEEAIQALQSHPEFIRFRFEVTLPEEEIAVLCDRLKLEQVFYNLFKNASDATDGKGVIRVEFAKKAPSNGGVDKADPLKVAHEEVVVRVEDNGPGIEPQTLHHIFDPFFTTKGSRGVGLGLSISYRTMEQHGGMLSVDSVLGEGTTFFVTLPVSEEKLPAVT